MPVFKSNGSFRTLGGNATVPNDAPIQPPQAFVDLFPQIVGNDPTKFCGYTSIIDLSNRAVTKCSGDYLHSGIVNGGPSNIDLSGNALTRTEVDAILHVFFENEDPHTTFDISGGTNAVPTLPVFVIDFNNLTDLVGRGYGLCNPTAENLISFDGGSTLNGDTSVDWLHGFYVGTDGGTATKQQIINKLVALGGGKIVDIGGLKIRVSPTNHDLEPVEFTGMTGSSLTQGNNDIGALRSNGWTVITN